MKTEVIKLYENREDVTLTTYLIDDSPELLNGQPRPAIIICPGGAYLNCSDREAEPVALRFAAMGYHAFVLRYSTYLGGMKEFPDITKEMPPKETCMHPRPMREIGKAMLIIREHADEWLVDVNRIALCGFSAGAHNCAMYATNWHNPIISEFFSKDPEYFRPAATILCYPVIDYTFMAKTSMGKMARRIFDACNIAFLGTKNPDQETLKEVSPSLNVTEHTPPTFLWTTSSDDLVPVQHTILMANALANKNIPFEVHIFEEGPHGLSLANQTSAQVKMQINHDVTKWVELAEKWLEKRFALPVPEKPRWVENS